MTTLFWLFGVLAIVGALGVLFQTHPVRGALFLLLNFLAIGVLYLLARAPFVGFVQILVYAGAIVVLFLVAIMVMDLRRLESDFDLGLMGFLTFVLGVAFFVIVALVLLKNQIPEVSPPPTGTPEALGEWLFGRYLVPFELASILLLVAIVGAIVLIRRRRQDVS